MGAAPSATPLGGPDDASLAAALFAIDPIGLSGISARGGPSPARDAWTAMARGLWPASTPVRRLPPGIEDERLLGGMDLGASLAAGRPVIQRGVLAESDGGLVLIPMAERLSDGCGARLAAALDDGEVRIERDGLAVRLPARFGVIALDEGVAADERPPNALLERLAFRVDFDSCECGPASGPAPDGRAVAAARRRLARVAPAGDDLIEALCQAAELLGLGSARAPLMAMAAARAHAALAGRRRIVAEDVAVAARLVLAPRALTVPAEMAPEEAEAPPEPPHDDHDETLAAADPAERTEMPTDAELVIAAVRAALPEGLLTGPGLEGRAPPPRRAGPSGAGAAAKSARRGTPAGARSGPLRPGDRLNLVETLRAATPWQKLRGGSSTGRVQVRKQDFRIRRFVRRTESTTLFVVDASGSTAFQRLAEAKGAVELMLAKAYVSRAHVALIAFRGAGASVLLPPTRSLARARRQLSELPGGGGTPLAAGIDAALVLASAEVARGRTALSVFLTDGRANIGRDGASGRAAAEADALAAAARLRQAGLPSVFLDTSQRPRPDGDRFAQAMGGRYAPLPYADADAILGLVAGGGRAC